MIDLNGQAARGTYRHHVPSRDLLACSTCRDQVQGAFGRRLGHRQFLRGRRRGAAMGWTTTTTEPAPKPEPKANVFIVASKSLCTATGIDDAYTGTGHVEFFYTFTNSGGADGKAS